MTNYLDTGAANAVVTRTLPAAAYTRYALQSVTVSWSGAVPTIGVLTVTDNGVTVFSADIPLALNSPFNLPVAVNSSASGQAMVITVAAGGTGAIAKLNTVVKSVPSST